MAAQNTAKMLSALSSDESIKIVELLSEGDMSLNELIKKTGYSKYTVLECLSRLEECGLLLSTDDDESIFFLDAKQFAILTGFFELILSKCSPPKCC